MTKLKITSFGTSAGITLPDALMVRLGVGSGDVLEVRETASGIELMPYGGQFEAQMAVAEEVMAENYELLSKLAK
jgi:antitoxin component of MazEF toxin-antitoxin module